MPPLDSNNILNAADGEALDALIDAGLDTSALGGAGRARADRVLNLLTLAAGAPVAPSARLAEGILAKVAATGRVAPSFASAPPLGPKLALTDVHEEPELVPDDEEALDAYVTAGFRPEKVSSSLRDRAVQLERLGTLIVHAGTAPTSAGLTERTLTTVANARKLRPGLSPTHTRGSGFRLADMVSLAAALVLGVSVLWPVLATYRVHASRAACAANMATLAGGFGQYASDYRDSMPMAAASLGGPSWWDVGTTPERSNSANLYQLPRQQYVRPADMACAGNPTADRATGCNGKKDWDCLGSVSYSYHVMFGDERPQWGERSDGQPMVILADKSPVIARAIQGQIINPFENSTNHRGDGQWALRTDGSAMWLSSPQIGGDNIWLHGVIDAMLNKAREEIAKGTPIHNIVINGNELPVSRNDTFVGP